MIKCIFLVLSVLQFSFATVASKPKHPRTKIYGKWLLLDASGGFSGKGPGWDLNKTIVFEFSSKGKFKRTEGGNLVEKDNFKLIQAKTIFADSLLPLIDFKKGADLNYSLSGDTLSIRENVFDGFSYLLKKYKPT